MDELNTALALAEPEELHLITTILFQRRFNPLDYLHTPLPSDICGQSDAARRHAIAQRFRFLAADGVTVLRQRTGQLPYRDCLRRVCRYLQIEYRDAWSVEDLEAEIFLHLLEKRCKQLPKAEQTALNQQLARSLQQSPLAEHLPRALRHDPLRLVLTGGSAIAVTSVIRPWLLRQIARQFALHAATYQVSKQVLAKGGLAIASQLGHKVSLQLAARGMSASAARYAATRGVLAVVGPALWGWFLADLGWRTISTNYGRVIPVVFTLAQIRLIRSDASRDGGSTLDPLAGPEVPHPPLIPNDCPS